MKEKVAALFKNTSIELFIYNLGELKNSLSHCTPKERLQRYGLKPYNGDILEGLPKTNIIEILDSHFTDVKISGNHRNVRRSNWKMYYYDRNGKEISFTCLAVTGRQAIIETLELSKMHDWTIAVPNGNELVCLDELPSYGYEDLDDFLVKYLSE